MKREIKEYRGIRWQSDRDLSLELDRGLSYVYEWRLKGKTHEQIIDSNLDKEYKGIKWYSDADLSNQLGKCAHYVRRHLSKGQTREELIDQFLSVNGGTKK